MHMDQKNFEPLNMTDFMTCGDFDATPLGEVMIAITSGDVKKISRLHNSLQIIASTVSSILNSLISGIEGRELCKAETARLTESLYLLSSLSQLVSNVALAMEEADFQLEKARGAVCH